MSTLCLGLFAVSIVTARLLFDFQVRPLLRERGHSIKSDYINVHFQHDLEVYAAEGGSEKVYKSIKNCLTLTYVFFFLFFVTLLRECGQESGKMRQIMKDEQKARTERLLGEE